VRIIGERQHLLVLANKAVFTGKPRLVILLVNTVSVTGTLFGCFLASAPSRLSLIQVILKNCCLEPCPRLTASIYANDQEERLERLRGRAAEPFRPDDDAHQALLRHLWSHAFPDVAFTSPKSSQWKEMGWQVISEGGKGGAARSSSIRLQFICMLHHI